MKGNPNVHRMGGYVWDVTCDIAHDRLLVTNYSESSVDVLDRSLGVLSRVFRFGSKGTRPRQFDIPCGITTQPHTNNVIVTDENNHRVQIFDSDFRYLTEIKPTIGIVPIGVCCNPAGDIYVADSRNDRVQLFDGACRHLSTFGGVRSKELCIPYDVAMLDHRFAPSSLASSILLVVNCSNTTVCAWSMDGSVLINTFDTKVRGRGICVDLRGYVYVSTMFNTIKVFDPRSNFNTCQSTLSEVEFKSPSGMCVDNENALFISEMDQVRQINL